MPVVPFAPQPQNAPPIAAAAPPDPRFLMMAAAQMNKEGRFIKPGTEPNINPTINEDAVYKSVIDKLRAAEPPHKDTPPQYNFPTVGPMFGKPSMNT